MNKVQCPNLAEAKHYRLEIHSNENDNDEESVEWMVGNITAVDLDRNTLTVSYDTSDGIPYTEEYNYLDARINKNIKWFPIHKIYDRLNGHGCGCDNN